MASGGLTHTNVIASGAYGITTSPARNRNSSTIKTKANDLLDQIKQLEIEGQKLRAQSLANLGKLNCIFHEWACPRCHIRYLNLKFITLSVNCKQCNEVFVYTI